MASTLAFAASAVGQDTGKAADVTFTYPAKARAIPALRRWLDAEAARFRSARQAKAVVARREAEKSGYPFRRYESDRDWKVVADTPRLLSLSLERYDFTGGAHGNSSFGSTVWDKPAGKGRAPLSFFTSPRALSAAIRPAFCRRLDDERQEKRGGDGRNDFADFSKCIDPVGETVILGSHRRGRFDRIGILIPPYEAGPYSEGIYEVTLPVTAAVLATVRPEWRRYFAIGTP